ncbi:cytoskeletal protein RodZ [Palleronia aestuarii]|uniref:Cytoskeletal protein RodZ n=1 Tax=Palleronia aestuarii TaxID=568105 RepID=A0A2W7NBH3_9RHOB|nr:helix-turn-helix domain-containing protein [Palleronia aestuarii]PZX17691.1 cytoskeletal protein RodZ [Palleronia aestuarii]
MTGRFHMGETRVGDETPRGFDDFDLRLGDVMRGERATLGKSLLDVQRELKIRATYIAAIENSDPAAFETPGFIAGYVRSYARYLDLDPDWAYRAFCAESDFETAHGMSKAASVRRAEPQTDRAERDPLAEPALGYAPPRDGFLSRIEPGAIGSLLVLLGLIGAIAYGGYAVLTEIQQVRITPVDQAPEVVADIDPLNAAQATGPLDAQSAAEEEVFDRIYRPEPLDVPVLVARDGPISAIDPRLGEPLVSAVSAEPVIAELIGPMPAGSTSRQIGGFDAVDIASLLPPGTIEAPEGAPGVQVVEDGPPEVVVIAVRPSWVRVRSAEGTTLYERIMQEGDRFVLPPSEVPATLRTGESGAIFFAVNGTAYGPAGPAGQVTGNLDLDGETLAAAYDVADLEAESALARVVADLRPEPPLPGQSAPAATE